MKRIKKVLLYGVLGLGLTFGISNVASAANTDDGIMARLEKAVVRIEKALSTSPTKFTKSTLVDIKNVKIETGSFSREVVGDVTNNTGSDLDQIYITFKMYDAKGKVLSENPTTVIDSLKAGETVSFNSYISNKDGKTVKVSEVSVKSIAIN